MGRFTSNKNTPTSEHTGSESAASSAPTASESPGSTHEQSSAAEGAETSTDVPHIETAAEKKAREPKTLDEQLRSLGERHVRKVGELQGALAKLEERKALLSKELGEAQAAAARIELALGSPIALTPEPAPVPASVDTPTDAVAPSADAISNLQGGDVVEPPTAIT